MKTVEELERWSAKTKAKYLEPGLTRDRMLLRMGLWVTLGLAVWGLIWHFQDPYAKWALIVEGLSLIAAPLGLGAAFNIRRTWKESLDVIQ